MSRNNLIQFRKGTLAQFNSANPTLASGEPGFAIDAKVLKVGDGVTPWSGLLGFSVGSGISSLNGLTASALVIDGGHNIQVTTSGTEVISVAYTGVDHRIVPGLTNINNNGNTFIQDLLFDQYGHVTGVASVAVTGIGASVPDNVLVSGDNISFLTNDIGYDTIPSYTLGASGSSHYLFSGPGLSSSTPDPTLYLVRGRTYKFVNNMGAHPFQFQTSAGIGGTAYTSGIDNSPITNATMTWEIRHDTPNTLYYQCTSHSNMQGIVYVLDKDSHPSISAASDINNSGNTFVQDILFDSYGHVTGVVSVAVTGIDSVPSNVIVSGDNISLLTNDAGYATTGELTSVSGHLQGQIDSISSDTNTFVSGIVYHTGTRDLVLTRNDGVLLTGDFSSVLHSGDNISLLINDTAYITGFNETDPIFTSSVAYNITAIQTGQWSEAYSWQDHSTFGYATTGELSAVSGYLQGQINALPSDTNTFVNNIIYNTGNREIVLSKNDGVQLTGDLSVVLHSGDNISLLNNNLGYITGFTETISSGDPISFLVNDVPYAISGSHIDISAASSVNESGRTYVQDILLDQYGHITGINTATELTHTKGIVNILDDTTTDVSISGGYKVGSIDIFVNGVKLVNGTDFAATDGSGIVFSTSPESGSILEFISLPPSQSISTFAHPNISAATSVDNSGNTFIQDLVFDSYGHVIGVVSALASGTSGVSSETDPIFTGSIAYNITAVQTGQWSEAYSWGDHSQAGYASTGTLISVSGHLQTQINAIPTGHINTDAISSIDNSGNTFIQDLLFDQYGHVTGVSSVAATGISGDNSAQLIAVSGHLQSQIDAFTDSNTFVSGISYSTAEKDLVLTRNDGVKLTGDFSSVLHSGDNISLLVNNVPYAISGSHIDVSGASNNYFLQTQPNNTFVHDLMFDTFGHVTGVILAQASGFLNDDAFVTGVFFDSSRNLNLLLGGGAGTLSVNIPASGSSSHPSIDAVASVDNSNNNFVQDLLFDTYGHVTGVVSAAVTGITSGGSTGDIYLTGVVFDTSTRNLTFSWNSGVSDITVNIPSSGGGSSGGGVLSSSGVNNILVASTGISIIHNTGTSKIQIGTTLNHTALHHFFQ